MTRSTSQPESSKSLVLSVTSGALGLVGAGVAVLGAPGLAALFASGSVAATLASDYENRHAQRALNRWQSVIEDRLDAIERFLREASDDRIDLFREIAKTVLDDDDHQKIKIYDALLDWFLKEKPPRTHVVILIKAINELPYVAIWVFVHAIRDGSGWCELTDPLISKETLRELWKGAGLGLPKVSTLDDMTTHGRILREIVGSRPLPKPNDFA